MNGKSARFAAVSAFGLVMLAGLSVVSAPRAGAAAMSDPYENLPMTMTLSGVLRDFKKYNISGGHADFEQYNSGHRVGMVQRTLDADGKPVYLGMGKNVTREYKDSRGRTIDPAIYNPAMGDVVGTMANATNKAVMSSETFGQWYRDAQGVNISKPFAITLTRQAGSNNYVFFQEDNAATEAREGFFPADNDMFNDMDSTYHHNYHFTYELATMFTYKSGIGQAFRFVGDDDVYVFIDGKLAIDVGGVHGSVDQSVDLDRFAAANGLVDGRDYALKFFFAERHTTRSNCRIETSLTLRPAPLPTTTALAD